ncbi:FPL domain-containing protein [Balamuthia mandrillaris]
MRTHLLAKTTVHRLPEMQRIQSMWTNLRKPKNKFTLDHLKTLHEQLTRNRVITEKNQKLIIETLRQIAEIMIWGDQHNTAFFDFFLEKNILGFFLDILSQKSPNKVKVQLLQTLSILVENIRSETALYYLLSNNHINDLITHKFDFSDEEVLAYYISFLKTLSLKLNKNTIQFFFNVLQNDFPLYTEAVKFFNHRESMVRTAVRNLALNVFKVEDEEMRRYVLDKRAAPYFSNMVWFISDQCHTLDELVIDSASTPTMVNRRKLEDFVHELLDVFYYIQDIFNLNISELSRALSDHLLKNLLLPLFAKSLLCFTDEDEGHDDRINPALALFLLAQVFHIFSYRTLVNTLGAAMIHPDPIAYVSRPQTQDDIPSPIKSSTKANKAPTLSSSPSTANSMPARSPRSQPLKRLSTSVLHTPLSDGQDDLEPRDNQEPHPPSPSLHSSEQDEASPLRQPSLSEDGKHTTPRERQGSSNSSLSKKEIASATQVEIGEREGEDPAEEHWTSQVTGSKREEPALSKKERHPSDLTSPRKDTAATTKNRRNTSGDKTPLNDQKTKGEEPNVLLGYLRPSSGRTKRRNKFRDALLMYLEEDDDRMVLGAMCVIYAIVRNPVTDLSLLEESNLLPFRFCKAKHLLEELTSPEDANLLLHPDPPLSSSQPALSEENAEVTPTLSSLPPSTASNFADSDPPIHTAATAAPTPSTNMPSAKQQQEDKSAPTTDKSNQVVSSVISTKESESVQPQPSPSLNQEPEEEEIGEETEGQSRLPQIEDEDTNATTLPQSSNKKGQTATGKSSSNQDTKRKKKKKKKIRNVVHQWYGEAAEAPAVPEIVVKAPGVSRRTSMHSPSRKDSGKRKHRRKRWRSRQRKEMPCTEDWVEQLLLVLIRSSHYRLLTLQMATLLIKDLICSHDSVANLGGDLKKLLEVAYQNAVNCAKDRLNGTLGGIFLQLFEEEMNKFKQLNFDRLITDPSSLLPVTETSSSKLALAKRMPSGEMEKTKRAIQGFLVLRELKYTLLCKKDHKFPLKEHTPHVLTPVGSEYPFELAQSYYWCALIEKPNVSHDPGTTWEGEPCILVINPPSVLLLLPRTPSSPRSVVGGKLEQVKAASNPIVQHIFSIQGLEVQRHATDPNSLYIIPQDSVIPLTLTFPDEKESLEAKQALETARIELYDRKLRQVMALLNADDETEGEGSHENDVASDTSEISDSSTDRSARYQMRRGGEAGYRRRRVGGSQPVLIRRDPSFPGLSDVTEGATDSAEGATSDDGAGTDSFVSDADCGSFTATPVTLPLYKERTHGNNNHNNSNGITNNNNRRRQQAHHRRAPSVGSAIFPVLSPAVDSPLTPHHNPHHHHQQQQQQQEDKTQRHRRRHSHDQPQQPPQQEHAAVALSSIEADDALNNEEAPEAPLQQVANMENTLDEEETHT